MTMERRCLCTIEDMVTVRYVFDCSELVVLAWIRGQTRLVPVGVVSQAREPLGSHEGPDRTDGQALPG